MFDRLRKQWETVAKSPPGKRFRHRYEWRRKQRASPLWTPFYIVVGTALFVVGAILLFFPGPGFLVIFVGAAVIAQESLWTAALLDRTEVRVRAWAASARKSWRRASMVARAAAVTAAVVTAAATGWTAYVVLMG